MSQPSYVNDLNNNWVNNRPPTASEPLDSGTIALYDSWWDSSTSPWTYYICMDATPDLLQWQKNHPISKSYNNSPGRSLTTGTGATGFQISSTQDSIVNYSITISTTSTLTGNSSGYVALEISPTNSSTAGDWVEIGRSPSGQSNTLVIGITLNQTGGGQLGGIIPAGYYCKLRSVNVSGTPTYTYNSGQEVLF